MIPTCNVGYSPKALKHASVYQNEQTKNSNWMAKASHSATLSLFVKTGSGFLNRFQSPGFLRICSGCREQLEKAWSVELLHNFLLRGREDNGGRTGGKRGFSLLSTVAFSHLSRGTGAVHVGHTHNSWTMNIVQKDSYVLNMTQLTLSYLRNMCPPDYRFKSKWNIWSSCNTDLIEDSPIISSSSHWFPEVFLYALTALHTSLL